MFCNQCSAASLLLLAAWLCAGSGSGLEAAGQLVVTQWAPESLQMVKAMKGFLCIGRQGTKSERHPHSDGEAVLTTHAAA